MGTRKLKLEEIKVRSFVTKVEGDESVRGGTILTPLTWGCGSGTGCITRGDGCTSILIMTCTSVAE